MRYSHIGGHHFSHSRSQSFKGRILEYLRIRPEAKGEEFDSAYTLNAKKYCGVTVLYSVSEHKDESLRRAKVVGLGRRVFFPDEYSHAVDLLDQFPDLRIFVKRIPVVEARDESESNVSGLCRTLMFRRAISRDAAEDIEMQLSHLSGLSADDIVHVGYSVDQNDPKIMRMEIVLNDQLSLLVRRCLEIVSKRCY